GRALGDVEGDRGAHGDGSSDPLGAAARPRRPPGGRLRRAGRGADDQARHDVAGSVRAWCPARAREGARAAGGPHRRARRPPVITFVVGDLTEQRVDAIVNAANEALVAAAGVCGAIRRAGGVEIFDECARLDGCATGDAKATGAGRLPARHVIHAVGPIWRGGDHGEAELLASAHRRALEVAEDLGCRTIAFPAISTGIYGYP